MPYMAWDWLSPAVSGLVGVAGLYFGWLSGKQSRDHAERLARHNDQHSRLMTEQRDAHARAVEEDRRRHEQRMVDVRLKTTDEAPAQAGQTAVDMQLHWRRQVRDLRLREADGRQALADAVAAELRARRAPG
jgi:hypothetical protein